MPVGRVSSRGERPISPTPSLPALREQHLAFNGLLNTGLFQGYFLRGFIQGGSDATQQLQGPREDGKLKIAITKFDLKYTLWDQAFDYADVEFKGSLTKRQYKIAMTAVFGCRPDKTEIKQVFQSTERISYEIFELWVSKKCVAKDSQVNAEVLFALLDKDYKGYLVLEDFYSASRTVDLKVHSQVWQMVFKELDRQRKGRLGFDEFLYILPSAYECTAR